MSIMVWNQQAQECESLRRKLAEKDKEIEQLKSENRDACIGLNDYFGQQLAASQLHAEQLREALQTFIDEHEECTDADGFTAQIVSLDDYHEAQEAIASVKGGA